MGRQIVWPAPSDDSRLPAGHLGHWQRSSVTPLPGPVGRENRDALERVERCAAPPARGRNYRSAQRLRKERVWTGIACSRGQSFMIG